MSTAQVTPPVICPDWCKYTQENHRGLEDDDDRRPWQSSEWLASGDGWAVDLCGATLMDGTVDPDCRFEVGVYASEVSPQAAVELARAIVAAARRLDPTLTL